MQYIILLCIGILSVFSCVFGEGSKDWTRFSGNRAFLEYSTGLTYVLGPSTNIIQRINLLNVYVRSGETLLLASSSNNVGVWRINFTTPTGQTWNCVISSTTGRILNLGQELAWPLPMTGGFISCSIPITSTGEGIWTIHFIAPGGWNPWATAASGAWTQTTAIPTAAWDITVRNTSGLHLSGRVFTNFLNLNVGGNNRRIYQQLYVVTKDGYQYQLGLNGIDPFGFLFFVNNKGIQRLGSGKALYQSVAQTALSVAWGSTGIWNPSNIDTGTDITHKIFINPPDPTLPTSAVSANGVDWILNTAPIIPYPSGFTFVGSQGTTGQMGAGMSGYFVFQAPTVSDYKVILDIGNDGVYGNSRDVTLQGTAQSGYNAISWDGKDGSWLALTGVGSWGFAVQIRLFGGVVHFPVVDAETHLSGYILKRINGIASPDWTLYFDHRSLGLSGALTGLNSISWSNRWLANQGNNRVMNTWSYIQSDLIILTGGLVITQADIGVQKSMLNSWNRWRWWTGAFLITLTNSGPSFATWVRVIDLVTWFFSQSLWSCVSGYVCQGSWNVDAFINIPISGQVTLVVTGRILPNFSGTLFSNVVRALKGNDMNDPNDPNGTWAWNNSFLVTWTLNPQADLWVSINVVQTWMVGSGFVVLVSYYHSWFDLSTGVSLTVQLPLIWTDIQFSTGVLSGNMITLDLPLFSPWTTGVVVISWFWMTWTINTGFMYATISGSVFDGYTGNNTTSSTVETLLPLPSISVVTGSVSTPSPVVINVWQGDQNLVRTDTCPEWDNSPSYYDGSCGSVDSPNNQNFKTSSDPTTQDKEAQNLILYLASKISETDKPSSHFAPLAPEIPPHTWKQAILDRYFKMPKELLKTWPLEDLVKKKGVKFTRSPKVDTTPLPWIQQRDPDIFSSELSYWLDIMPDTVNKNAEIYLVIPRQGIIAPINRISPGTKDFNKLTNGTLIDPNPYLQWWVVHYPLSAEPGVLGNMVVAGHSSYFKKDKGQFKTIFLTLPLVEMGEHIWIYKRDETWNYELFKYSVSESFNTPAKNVSVIKNTPQQSTITLFGCTPIGGAIGRRIIKWTLIE